MILACAANDFTVSHETNSLPGNKMYVARLKKFSLQKTISISLFEMAPAATNLESNIIIRIVVSPLVDFKFPANCEPIRTCLLMAGFSKNYCTVD
jgi:hypothetical protein